MKKIENLFLPMFTTLLFIIFLNLGCGKEKMKASGAMVTDTNSSAATTDTTINKDSTNISLADTSKHGDTFLALGDSYTIGQSIAPQDRFPAQTVQSLNTQYIHVKSPDYIAVTGWTTSNLMSAILYQNPPKNYDIVTLLIGVNDQYLGMDTSEYSIHFRQLLKKSIELAANLKTHVFVLSIPDYSATPFVNPPRKAKVSKEIDLFNFINKRITTEYKIAYINITPSTQLAASDPSLIAGDGLHPSGKEYKLWADLLVPEIKKIIVH